MTEKRQCDDCGVTGTSKTIHGVRTVKGSNDGITYHCKSCWARLMVWRKNKNKHLPQDSPRRVPTPNWRN